MEIKAIYIGNDSGYWFKLKSLFESNYEGIDFSFHEVPTNESSNERDLFVSIYKEKPQIVYIDFEYESETALRLSKLLNRNNEMRLISLIGLYSVNQDVSVLTQGMMASIRLNHIKSIEIEDVVYDAVSLYDINLAEGTEYVKSEGELVFEVLQPLRIGYIEDNRFHVETNSYLEEGEIVSVYEHPLMKIMPSKKVYVEKFYDSNLYYNRRFAYDLEFIYIDDDFFTATNERWKLYKDLKENPMNIENLPAIEREEVLADMEKRREKFAQVKYLIDKWLTDREGNRFSKRLKIMIVDDTLEVLKSLNQTVDKFPYSINFQTLLLNDFYQLKRSMPHLVAMRITEVNTMDVLGQMISKINFVEDYDPFVIIYGSEEQTEDVRKKLDYDKLLVRIESDINVSDIKNMASALDAKLNISGSENRVFFKSSAPESLMYLNRFVKIYAMTESELYIYSEIEIPMWTVFVARSPVKVLLTVVPHKDTSAYANQPGYYRCLINGAGEIEKAALRRVVNSTLSEDEEEASTEEELGSE